MSKITVLRVVSKRASFRRVGFQFSAEPLDIPVANLSKEQRAAIDEDNSLVAYELEVDVPEATDEVAKPVAKSGTTKK
ncbi:MAG: hypothetical protein Q7T62_18070 [Undibacterium sp.]|nr:hypothetical protein [Undibacterium sp.]